MDIVTVALYWAMHVAVILLVFYGVTYFVQHVLDWTIPEKIMKLIWIIVVIAILIVTWRAFSPMLGIRF